jgi:DNA-binding response OmpR family regulator
MNQCVLNDAVIEPNVEHTSSRQTVALPGGVADLARCEVRFANGERIALSKSEASLLGYLARHPGRVVSRHEILKHVWHLNPVGIVTRTVDMHVSNLRRKLRDKARRPAVLLTISRQGYLLIENVKPTAF